MKSLKLIIIALCTVFCLSCDEDLLIEGGWDMTVNNPITLNFGQKGGSSVIQSLNFENWEIKEMTGEVISNIISAEVIEDNKIEIKVAENKNTISCRVLVGSDENPDLVGEIIINQNSKRK